MPVSAFRGRLKSGVNLTCISKTPEIGPLTGIGLDEECGRPAQWVRRREAAGDSGDFKVRVGTIFYLGRSGRIRRAKAAQPDGPNLMP